MNKTPAPPPAVTPERPAAERYWDQVLDVQNLEREADGPAMDLETEIGFVGSPDFLRAVKWLRGARVEGTAWVADLGAGLGAPTFALARAGLLVLAIDTSPARLRALMERARQAGVADRIRPVVARAEALPLARMALAGVFTKSVLIHTDLPRAAAEIGRVLAPGGRAALLEPQPGNPFVSMYRRFLAPAAWRGITIYFGPARHAIVAAELNRVAHARLQVEPFFFIAFFAFVFQYAWPRLAVFRGLVALLHRLERPLMRYCPRLAWFGLMLAERPRHNID